MFGVVNRQLLQDEWFGLLVDQGGCIGLSLDRVDQVVDQVVRRSTCRSIAWKSRRAWAGSGAGVPPRPMAVDSLMASRGVWR